MKRLLKNVLSFALAVSILLQGLSAVSVFAEEASDNSDTTYSTEATELLSNLGILDTTGLETVVTRGEFAIYAANMLELNTSASVSERYFKDVPPNSRMASAVHQLYKLRYMLGTGDATFSPDEPMTAASAAVVMLRIAGYGNIMTAENQAGFIARCELLKGVTANEITGYDLAEIMYNALNAPICVTNGNNEYEIDTQTTLMYSLYKMYRISGVVVGADSLTLDSSKSIDVDEIIIGDTICQADDAQNSELGKLLGIEIDAYVKEDRKTPILVSYTIATEKMTEFALKDLAKPVGSNLKIEYYDDSEKLRTVDLAGNAIVIKNGEIITSNLSAAFSGSQGSVRITKHSNIDIAVISAYDSVFVNNVNTDKEVIYAKHGTNITLTSGIDRFTIVDADGNEATLEDIAKGMLLTVYRSSKAIEIHISPESAEGTIEEIGDELITIGGNRYEIEPSYKSEFMSLIKLGTKGTFMLNIFGEIAYYQKASGIDVDYGFLKDASIGTGIGSELSLRIFTADGEMQTFEAVKKVKIDEVSSTSPADANSKLLSAGNGVISQLITYKLNSDGKVASIDTLAPGGDLKQTGALKRRMWYNPAKIFIPDAPMKSSLVVFKTPALADAASAGDDKFRIVNNSLSNGKSYNCTTYSCDVEGFQSDVTLIAETADMAVSWGDAEYPLLFDEVRHAINSEGEASTYITLCGNRRWGGSGVMESYEISPDFEAPAGDPDNCFGTDESDYFPGKRYAHWNELSQGDIVIVSVDEDNRITRIILYFDYGTDDIDDLQFKQGDDRLWHVARKAAGYAVEGENDVVGLSYTKGGAVNYYAHLNPVNNIMVYDSSLRENKVYIGSLEDVQTMEDYGEDASVIMPMTVEYVCRSIIIYKNGLPND